MSVKIQEIEYKSQLLDLLSENLPDMLWVKDRDGKYIFANESICNNLLMAKNTQEPIGKGDVFFALRERETQPDNPNWHTFGELCFNSDEVVIENDKPMRFEEYGNIKGKLTYLEVFKAPFYDENGKIIGTVGAGRDITEYKKVQQELKNSLDKIDDIQAIAGAGTWELDLLTGALDWSKEMYKIYGVSPETFTPSLKTIAPFLSSKDGNKIAQAIEKGKKTLEMVELQYTLHKEDASSTHLLVRAKAVKDESDTVTKIIGTSLDITSQHMFESIIEKQKNEFHFKATHDELTGLPNRVLFLDRLNHAIYQGSEKNSSVVVLFLDVDNFKPINDSFGHDAGDKVLIELSKRMQNKSRRSDTIARLGGDEFCIILDEVNDIDSITTRLKIGMNIVNEPFIIEDKLVYIGLSIGVAIYPKDGKNAQELLRNADTAMYKAKREGKGRFSFYDEALTSQALASVTMESELRNAIRDEVFEVYFQPQVNALTGSITGMEALVRWPHKELGLIPPNDFIPLAESLGLIVSVDKIVMKKALHQFAQWNKEGLNPGTLSMNLTMQMLLSENFLEFIEALICSFNCDKTQIELEITESEIMHNPAQAIEILNALSALNIKLSIDDFGTGYSSLAYLKKLPINKLKIDKSFVDELPYDSDDVAIVKAVISLALSLGLEIIAEGVEEEAQKEFLIEHNCLNIQGYLFAKPLNAKEMSEYLVR